MKTIEGEITVYLIVRVHTNQYPCTNQHTHIHSYANGFVWKQMQWSEKSELMPTNDWMNEITNHFTNFRIFFFQGSWNKINQYHNKMRREKIRYACSEKCKRSMDFFRYSFKSFEILQYFPLQHNKIFSTSWMSKRCTRALFHFASRNIYVNEFIQCSVFSLVKWSSTFMQWTSRCFVWKIIKITFSKYDSCFSSINFMRYTNDV